MEFTPTKTNDMTYPWKYGKMGLDIYTDTYLASMYGIHIIRDIFEYDVLSDMVLVDKSIDLYSGEIQTNGSELKIILKNQGVDVCMIKSSSKLELCMVAYFMDLYYANESESERAIIQDSSSSEVEYYSRKDRPSLIEARKRKAKKSKTAKIKKIQHAFAKAIMSDEFLELVRKNM